MVYILNKLNNSYNCTKSNKTVWMNNNLLVYIFNGISSDKYTMLYTYIVSLENLLIAIIVVLNKIF